MPGQRSPAKHYHGVQKPGSNGNNHITAEMLQRALTGLPERFEYPLKLRKQIGVIGNKDSLGSNVHGAPKCKVMFVHHVANDTDDNAMKAYIEKNMCKVQRFEKASNLASSAKSSRVKVLVDDAKKIHDSNVWPSGIGCNYWKFKMSYSDG